MSDHMPEVVGLCPDPACRAEFYMPHGGPCPMECDQTLVEYRRPVVTDEMVERGAQAIHGGKGCTCRAGARGDARAVLVAALDGGERA